MLAVRVVAAIRKIFLGYIVVNFSFSAVFRLRLLQISQ